jgi:predicted HTH transcriptional regulator
MKRMNEPTKCDICGCDLSDEEIYSLNEKTLCEDCHMEETHPVKVCNPLPVMAAKKIVSKDKDAENSLSELQKTIYKHIMGNQKVTIKQLCTKFSLTEVNLNNQLAILRHLELIKGKKDGDTVYIVPF